MLPDVNVRKEWECCGWRVVVDGENGDVLERRVEGEWVPLAEDFDTDEAEALLALLERYREDENR